MRNKDADSEKISLWQRLERKLDIPSDLFNGIFVEMRGRRCVIAHGCRNIALYTPQKVVISMAGCRLAVEGSNLYCSAYHKGVVNIDGVIVSVCFEEAEKC